MDRKVCFKCEEEKDLDEFYPHPKMKDGHVNKCKECNKTDNTKHRDKNLDKIRQYDRDRSTLPHRKALNAKISERFCRENPEKRKAHNAALANKIKKIKRRREKLEVERNVKARVLSDPRSYRSEERVKECGRRIKEIDKKISEIDQEIEGLNKQFITINTNSG